MDDEDPAQQNAVGATWPPPPPFWMSFTPENLTRIEDLRQQAGSDGLSQAPSPPRLPGLPRELRNLQPPPEPQEAVWRLFGGNYKLVDELPKLEDQGVRRLFPDPADRDQDGRGFDRALILKRLAKSLLLNFVELTGILGARPDAVCLLPTVNPAAAHRLSY